MTCVCRRFVLELLAANFSDAKVIHSLLCPAFVFGAATSGVAKGLAGDAGWLEPAMVPKLVSGEQDIVVSHLGIGQLVAKCPIAFSASEVLCHGEACDADWLSATAVAFALSIALSLAFALATFAHLTCIAIAAAFQRASVNPAILLAAIGPRGASVRPVAKVPDVSQLYCFKYQDRSQAFLQATCPFGNSNSLDLRSL